MNSSKTVEQMIDENIKLFFNGKEDEEDAEYITETQFKLLVVCAILAPVLLIVDIVINH